MLKLPSRKETKDEIDREISGLLNEMANLEDPTGEKYQKLAEAVETLKKAQSYEKPKFIKGDTILLVLGNLGVVGLVCLFEQCGHMIRTNATRFLMKGRS